MRLNDSFLEDLLDWGAPKPLVIKGKPYSLWEADASKEFWTIWRSSKEELGELGIRVNRDDCGDYKVSWWRSPEHQVDPGLVDEEPVMIQSWHHRDYNLGPEVGAILRTYQVQAAGTLMEGLETSRFVLDASEPGTGKTYTACAVAKVLAMNVGVVCPANVVTKWTDTMMDVFGIEPEFVLSYDALRSGKTDYVSRTNMVRRGKTIPRFIWNTCDPVMLIYDEVHTCSASDSLNAALLKGAIDNPDIYTLGLSATAASSPLMMKTLGYALGLHHYTDWWDWCQANGCREGFYGGLTFDARPGSRAERALKKIHRSIFPDRGCRITRAELPPGSLPTDVIVAETVDLAEVEITKEMRLALTQLEEKRRLDEKKAEKKEQAVSALTTTTRSRQESEILKSPCIAEKALELVAAGYSVPVFMQYSETIALVTQMLGRKVSVAHLVGGMGTAKRNEALARFMEGKARVILCQMDAGSASLDMHNAMNNFPRASVICPGYSARQLQQALGRINRDGSFDEECLQYILFAAEGVELRAARIVQSKINNIALLNDGDLGGAINVTEHL